MLNKWQTQLNADAKYLLSLLMHMWDNCANMVSLHYTGTDSNTNVSAGSGWTNAFSIMVTGVQRYWQKTFSDSQKNETIRMILGINLVYPECGVQKTVN